jgi:hypothetical protein
MQDGSFTIAYPRELMYDLPSSFPDGFSGKLLRVQNQNTIPTANGTPASTQIDIVIPEQPASFIDVDTTRLYVECTYTTSMTVPTAGGANSQIFIAPSYANGGFIGGGASIFQRYQLYLNNSTISDDIGEFGMVCYLMYLMNYTEEQRFRMASCLGFNKGYPSGCWGAAFHGEQIQDRATITCPNVVCEGEAAGGNGANSNAGVYVNGANATNYQPTQFNHASGIFVAAPAILQPAMVITMVQNYNFDLHIPGILGSGNNRMLPMFVGPYRISLWVDVTTNFFQTDFGQQAPNPLAQWAPTTSQFAVNSVWFVGETYRCDVPTFNSVMASLPKQNTFIFRTTAWTVSSVNFPVGTLGQTDWLIPPRKASVKTVYCLPSPGITNPAAAGACAGAPCNIWGKYGWVNPNLTTNTCILVNGTQYPQQGQDPMNRPADIWVALLEANKTWSNMGTKPAIAPQNFYVCDSITGVGLAANPNIISGNPAAAVPANVPNFYAYYNAVNTTQTGRALWRILPTTTFRFNLTPGTVALNNTINPYVGGDFNVPISGLLAGAVAPVQATAIRRPLAATNDIVIGAAGALPSMTDKTAPWTYFGASPSYVVNSSHFLEGTSACMRNNPYGFANFQIPMSEWTPTANQFIYACNLDQMTKPDVLTGMSTLTGSFFFRTNIAAALTMSYQVYFIVVFDQITVLDAALRTASVRF